MRDENGTEISRGNSTASYTVNDTTEDDFGTFNCTAESPDGMTQYLVELRKAGICMKQFSVIWLHSRSRSGKIMTLFGHYIANCSVKKNSDCFPRANYFYEMLNIYN